jgi:aminomethyltransferase
MEAGKAAGLVPCGLGARDTLRLEAAMPLYGHEMTDEISPLDTGLGFAVKMNKPDFIGKAALEKRGEPKTTRVGLKVTGKGIVREHCPVYVGDELIGETTSGTFLPYLGGAYAMALIAVGHAKIATAVEAEVRGRRVAAEVVELPFYKS